MSSAAVVIGVIGALRVNLKQQQDLSKGQESLPDSRRQRLAHHIKNFNVKLFADSDTAANANTNAKGSTIALPGLHPGELKLKGDYYFWMFLISIYKIKCCKLGHNICLP